MQKKNRNWIIALFLSLTISASPIAQMTYALGDEPEEEVVYQLTADVSQYAFNSSETSGQPLKNTDVIVTLGTGDVMLTSDDDGKIEYTFQEEEERIDTGKYNFKIEADENHYEAAGTIEEGTEEDPKENKINVRERYIPGSSDYRFRESDNVKIIDGQTWVKAAGTYAIEGVSSKRLATVLDGTAEDSINIPISATGLLESFFVYSGSFCSKILAGQRVKVDKGAPEITSVTTTAAKAGTYVKEHGIYGRDKAELALTVSMTEDAQVKEVYLVIEKDGTKKRYDAAKVSGSAGKYTATIGLPSEQTVLNAETVKVVAVDVFDKASDEVLIAESEEGSEVTLELDAPTLVTSVTPNANVNGWYKTIPEISATATDSISGVASLEITQDGSALERKTYSGKTAKESIKAEPNISNPSEDGSYEYKAKAIDNSGNISEKTFKLNIDTEAPVLNVTGVKSYEHYITVPTIQVTENERYYNAEGAYIRYRVGRDGGYVEEKTVPKVNKLTVPQNLFSKDGKYTVTIYAADAAGNEAKIVSYGFVKDSTPPELSLTGVTEGKYYASAQSVTLSVKERFYETNNVTVTAVKRLGGSTSNVGFPWSNTGETSTSSKSFSETGTYTVTAYAVDKAGNRSERRSLTFTVDTVPPVIRITGVKDGGVYTYGQGVSPQIEVTDDYLQSKTITYTKAGAVINNPSFAQLKENDGVYTLTVVATDMSGNTTRQQITFTLNRFGSHFEYNDAIKNLQGKGVQNVEKDLVITEKNVSKVVESESKIFKDNKALNSKAKTSANEDAAEKVYRHVFAASEFSDEGAYEINVISKDAAGNEMESKAENGPVIFYVDRTAPSLLLAGIDPKGNNASSITVTVNASDLLTGVKQVTAKIDGETPAVKEESDGTWSFTVNEGLRQKIEVTAVDGAGNKAETSEVASVSTSKLSLFLDRFKFVILGIFALIAGIIIFLLAKRRKDEKEPGEATETRE